MTSTIDVSTDGGVELVARLFGLEQALIDDPYPVYQRIREDCPVVRSGPLVAVARYEDVKNVLRDTTAFSSVRMVGSRIKALRSKLSDADAIKLDALVGNEGLWLVESDDPQHSRLRRFVNHTFSAGRIAEMREQVQEIASELLDAVDARGGTTVELVEDYCYKLPLYVICRLLGATPDETEQVRDWSDAIGLGIGTDYSNIEEAYDALVHFQEYVSGLIERSRGNPGATDLFSELVATDDNGTVLADEELVAMFTLLLFAGHETTTNLIANAVIALLEHPDQLRLLRDNPAVMKTAVDEFFRYCPSIHAVHRTATKDSDVAGFTIREGETVRVLLASANHDPEKFTDPEVFDITRKEAKQHVGLGFGIHTCLGIWLTKLETEVAVQTLLSRYPNLGLARERVSMRPIFTLHGPAELHLTT